MISNEIEASLTARLTSNRRVKVNSEKHLQSYLNRIPHRVWQHKLNLFAKETLIEYMVFHTCCMIYDPTITNTDINVEVIGRLYLYKMATLAGCEDDLELFVSTATSAVNFKNLMQNNVKSMLRRQGVKL